MMSDLLTKEVRFLLHSVKQVVILDEAMMASQTAGVLETATDMNKRYIYYEYGLKLKITELE
jgi:hypothetical protein